jgi:flagellar protein FliO/FliZ
MTEYIIRLSILLPLTCGAIYGLLYLTRKFQSRQIQSGKSGLEIIDILPLGQGVKLATVRFGEEKILIAVCRQGISRIASRVQS